MVKCKWICLLIVFLVFGVLFDVHGNDSIVVGKRRGGAGFVEFGVPAAMVAGGFIVTGVDGLKWLDYSRLGDGGAGKGSGWYDRFIPAVPAVAAFSMNLSGMDGVHGLRDMFVIYLLSNVLEAGIVFTAKSVVAKERPDGSGFDSFPSGHTSTAFVAAEFLHREYGGRSVWISAGGYGMAVLMGVSRVYNGRHRVSDVVAGAGIGILSARVVYMVYPYLRKTLSRKGGSHGASVFPAYVDGCLSLNLLYGF